MPEQSVPAPIQRVLDAAARKGVALEVRTFPESTHTAEDAASAVGAELGQIVKSLVFVAPGEDGGLEPIICLVSGPNRVDLARLAAVTGEPDVRRATAKEANELTGFVIGGIPPIGHPRPLKVVMDPDLGRYPVVWAAAGTDTAVFPVPPATLRLLANATVSPIAEERRRADVIAEAGMVNGRGEATSTAIPRTLGAVAASGPAFESVGQRGPGLELGERATVERGGPNDGAESAGRR